MNKILVLINISSWILIKTLVKFHPELSGIENLIILMWNGSHIPKIYIALNIFFYATAMAIIAICISCIAYKVNILLEKEYMSYDEDFKSENLSLIFLILILQIIFIIY